MAWGEWMVPTLSPQKDLELRQAELNLEQSATTEPHAVAALAAGLLRQVTMQQAIIEKATRRILELELAQELASRPAPRRRPWWAIWWPRLW